MKWATASWMIKGQIERAAIRITTRRELASPACARGTALPNQEHDARHHQPERPDDVGNGHQRAGKLPPGFLEGSGELERPDNQSQTDDDAGPAQPCGKDVALGHRHADEERPEPSE